VWPHCALDHSPLDLNSTPHRGDHARELAQHPVTGGLDDPAMVFDDFGVDECAAMLFEPLVRPLLIRPHQTRIASHVGGEDRGETAD
jgi:hypothetical protein